MAVNINLNNVENSTNKQNSLAADGTNTKYPTVTAVNSGLAGKQNVMGADDNYVTDAQLVVISNTSGTNTGDETTTTIGVLINNSTDINTIEDADKIPMYDAGGIGTAFKHALWSLVKSTLKTYFDTLYKATFSENTAFNKNFGTTSGTVCEGNDNRLSTSIHTAFSAALNPADATTYYSVIIGGLPQVSNASFGIRFLRTGTITDFNILAIHSVNGSGESTSIYLRNVTTATDYLITSSWLENYGTSTYTNKSYTGLSIPIGNTTDLWNIKIVYPTFATNPTNVQYSWGILIN